MVWTSPRTWVAGEIPTAATLNTHVRDNLKAIGDAWTAYTPTWTATSVNPAIGNGTLTGRYMQAGKLVFFSIALTFGSTTTAGTGAYVFTLPVAARGGEHFPLAQVMALDTSVPSLVYFTGRRFSTSTTFASTVQGASGANLASTTYTWATGDRIDVNGSYEAA